jgi:hypothetical protein
MNLATLRKDDKLSPRVSVSFGRCSWYRGLTCNIYPMNFSTCCRGAPVGTWAVQWRFNQLWSHFYG